METSDTNPHVPSLLRMILRSRRFKVLAVGSWLGYWLLYAVSGGMLFYYSTDITPLLKTSPVPNPSFINDFSGLFGFYNSGMVWYPNGHLQVNLLYGPTVFSIILSSLFSLNIALSVFGVRFARIRRGPGSVGVLALIPALFSGGCCSVPLGLSFVGIFAPTVGLATLVYDYPIVTNLAFVTVMILSLGYVGRRLAKMYPDA
jgi:hypothetical protein